MTEVATFAAVWVALYVGHDVGDHWVQRPRQALEKGGRGRRARVAAALHVGTLTVTQLVTLAVTAAVTGLALTPAATVAGLAVNASTHYVLDRRTPLLRLARWMGKGEFAALGDPVAAPAGTGAYALDLLCTKQQWVMAS